MKCVHWFDSDVANLWYCSECELETDNPWIVGLTKNHTTHDWISSEMEDWTECHNCGIQIKCDHECDFERDTVETPYMDINGYNTHERVGNFCIRCGYESILEDEEG